MRSTRRPRVNGILGGYTLFGPGFAWRFLVSALDGAFRHGAATFSTRQKGSA
jgi:hypothetical protein